MLPAFGVLGYLRIVLRNRPVRDAIRRHPFAE